jgi:hypothetical protein
VTWAPARAAGRAVSPVPDVYVETLTGRPVGRDGKSACPFHPDSRPSLHAYPDPAAGWACFSAQCWRGDRPNGGDIYDLAAQLWGLSTRGRDFLELRRRLYALFLPSVEPPAPRPPNTAPAYAGKDERALKALERISRKPVPASLKRLRTEIGERPV